MSQVITLPENHETILKSFLDSINSSTECEIRFGNFVKKERQFDDRKNEKEFVSNVEIDFFYRLKQILNSSGIKKKTTYTKDVQFKNAPNKKGKIRQTIFTDSKFQPLQNTKTINMLKNQHRTFDLFLYDCRVSLSTEKNLDRIDGVDFKKPTFFRYKNRTSYNFDYGVLDMTIVYQGLTEEEALSKNNVQYEIEFEIKEHNYESVMKLVSYILSVRQDNFFIINDNERKILFNEYRNLTNVPFFVGVQPETLQKDQLSLLFKELYSVTDKADGERYFMYIDSRGCVYFLDSNLSNMLKTNICSSKFKNCLLDGELVKKRETHELTHISFYAFDILFFNGNDLRENANFLLKQRLEKAFEVISSFESFDKYSFHMKKFIYRNVFMGSDIIMKNIQNKPYENDGLIFTPMNEPYPKRRKWVKLLKWKPSELNTIDFYTVKDGNKWTLYVQDKTEAPMIKKSLVEKRLDLVRFDVEKLCGSSDTTHITFETTFGDELIDPTTGEPFQTNTVIEFKWEGNKFVPLRTRWDKTSNPNKQGNFSSVACSIWNNIHNPITPNQLFQMTNTSTEQVSDKNFFFERMNDFHSKINQYLINKYIPKNNLNTQNCDKEFNPSENYILELNTFNAVKAYNTYTFCNSIKQTNLNYKNFKLDLMSESACHTISDSMRHNTCDAVFCLKFNQFFKSQECLENIIKTIDYNINTNGKLVLSFIDSEELNKLTSDFKEFMVDNEIMYYIHNKNTSTSVFNKVVKLFVNGISNENEPFEYLVDYNFLSDFMTKKGYKCIETELYSNLHKMYESQTPNKLLNYEKDISRLYRFCVFEKIESNVDSILNNKEELNVNSTNANYLIEHKNIQFHKIKTSYDIFNILNCLKFNIFKRAYSNKVLTSLDDIKLCMKECIKDILYYEKGMHAENKRSYMYFYNTFFEEEVEEEKVLVEQFYIVLLNNSIIQTKDNIETINNILNSSGKKIEHKDKDTEHKDKDTEHKDKDTEHKDTSENDKMKSGIKKELENPKITVVKLKEYLKQLGLKTTGKKDELMNRLLENLNN